MTSPKQTVKLNTYINFNGQCEAAFKFYAQALGGNIVTMLTWGKSPLAGQVSPEWREKICHASLQIEGNELAGTDVPPAEFQAPQGFQLLLDMKDLGEGKRVFETLAEKGTVRMPLQRTFWAGLYGIVIDQFGLSWEINCSDDKPTG